MWSSRSIGLTTLPVNAATLKDNPDDSRRGVSVPQGRQASGPALVPEDLARGRGQAGGVRAHQLIGPLLDGRRPLGIVAQCQARNAECGRLLLHAARVSEDQACVVHQAQEFEIAERPKRNEARAMRVAFLEVLRQSERLHALARPRMNGKEYRHRL